MKRLVWVLAFVCCAAIVYALIPSGPPRSEQQKMAQLIPPMRLENVAVEAALRAVLDAAERPTTVQVCSALAKEHVTVRTSQPLPLQSVLAGIAFQVGADLRLYGGLEGPHLALPRLSCVPFKDDYIKLEKRTDASR